MAKNTPSPKSLIVFPHAPGEDPNLDSGKIQVAVSGNALDHTAIRAGPTFAATPNVFTRVSKMKNQQPILSLCNIVIDINHSYVESLRNRT